MKTTNALAALSLATALFAGIAPGTARAAPAGSPWGAGYFPNVPLTTQDGREVRFYDDLVKDKRVVVTFIYTRCTKVCGLITANLARVQRVLGDRVGKDIQFYSISLDPEHDSPAVLKAYAGAFKVGPGWTFLTGRRSDIELLRRKFGDLNSVEEHSAHVQIGNDRAGQWWAMSALDNPRYLATVIGDWMDPAWQGSATAKSYAEAPRIVPPARGQVIFQRECSACHMANGQSVGPDLAGVVTRRGRAWVTRWLKAPEQLLAEKDPVALELLARSGDVPMPNPRLSDSALADVLAFLEASRAVRPAPVARARSGGGDLAVPAAASPR